MSGGDAMPDITLIGIAEGSFPASDAESMALAAEVLRLRDRVARAETVRDDAADAYDILVRRVWEAATGDTHEGPASVDVLLEAVAGLRARAEKAEAARDALRAATQKYRDAVDACHILEDDARDVSLQARLMREAVADGWTPEMVRAHRESDLSCARCAVGDARADLDAALAGEG